MRLWKILQRYDDAHGMVQLLESKNVEIERLMDENASLRRELDRLRETAGR
jgi:hypothetical protein